MPSAYEIAAALGRSLPNAYQVAPQPDHPYLLLGPSLIVGGDGRLTAIIRITKTVASRTLSARITACRLALPSKTRIVALLASESTHVDSACSRHFDRVISWSEGIRALAHYVQSDTEPRIKLHDLRHAKHLHAARSSAISQVTMLRRKQESPGAPPEELILKLQSRHVPQVSIPSIRYAKRREAVVLGSHVRALPAGRSMMASLRYASETELRSTYMLDDGVPYSSFDAPPSLLLLDTWPRLKSDPQKPFRAAAFSGWIMASSEDTQDVEELIERASEFVRKKVYERTQG